MDGCYPRCVEVGTCTCTENRRMNQRLHLHYSALGRTDSIIFQVHEYSLKKLCKVLEVYSLPLRSGDVEVCPGEVDKSDSLLLLSEQLIVLLSSTVPFCSSCRRDKGEILWVIFDTWAGCRSVGTAGASPISKLVLGTTTAWLINCAYSSRKPLDAAELLPGLSGPAEGGVANKPLPYVSPGITDIMNGSAQIRTVPVLHNLQTASAAKELASTRMGR